MSIKHTQGPWGYKLDEFYNIWSDKKLIAKVGGSLQTSLTEVEANAKLIAAAPEILEALIDAFEFIKNVDDWRSADPNMQLFENAIKKATE